MSKILVTTDYLSGTQQSDGGYAIATGSDPSSAPFAVTPSDTVALETVPKGLFIGTGGNVTLRGVNATADVTYKNLPNASYIAVRAAYVRATGTTATDIVAQA